MKKAFSVFISVLMVLSTVIFAIPADAVFEANFEPDCVAMLLVDIDNEHIVYEKNSEMQREPASLTKIMTCIIAIESIPNPESVSITVPEYIFEGLEESSVAGLVAGETLTAKDLLYALMVPSGNDASLVLADYIGNGDISKFVQMMNDKAQELGCSNTHFVNPHGLHDPEHYTTAKDMYIMTDYALKNEFFTEITSTARYEIPDSPSGKKRLLATTNRLITQSQPDDYNYFYKYAKGVKTGTTSDAGYCIVSTATKNKVNYLCVAMGAPRKDEEGKTIRENGAFVDTKKLYEWAFDNLKYQQILDTDQAVSQVKLKYAWQKDTLLLVPKEEIYAVIPKGVEVSSIVKTIEKPDIVKAPIQKGDLIGTISLEYAGENLGTVDLVAGEDIERSSLVYFWESIQEILGSTWFIIGLSILIFLIVLFIIIRATRHNNRSNKKSSRRINKF